MLTYSNGYWEVYRRFQEDFFGLGEGLRRGGYAGGTFLTEFVMGEENFHEGRAGYRLPALFKKKKQLKNKSEKAFSAGSKEQQ